ncbi:MAG TPA: hypothetical protein VLX29_06555 [Nitrospirota bacterium]|nr:hypothetical protein [Nitrospirota bacterium]
MRMRTVVIMVLFFTVGVIITPDCLAVIYKYVDKDGAIFFASDLQSIPEQHRASATIVSGELQDAEKTQANHHKQIDETKARNMVVAPGGIPVKPAAETAKRGSFGSRVLLSAIILVSALFVFAILKILDNNRRKSFAIGRLVIMWGVSVYLLYAHANDVLTAFRNAANTVENAQKQSAEKGKKAADVIKALDALVKNAGETASKDPAQGDDKKE